jgi:DNA-binding CsgD family transcriptional regulator
MAEQQQGPQPDPEELLLAHRRLTPAEKAVMALLAHGASDEEILRRQQITPAALRSRLDRLSRRTGLTGRLRVAWAARHEACRIEKTHVTRS